MLSIFVQGLASEQAFSIVEFLSSNVDNIVHRS